MSQSNYMTSVCFDVSLNILQTTANTIFQAETKSNVEHVIET
jgi:hypothetical protein